MSDDSTTGPESTEVDAAEQEQATPESAEASAAEEQTAEEQPSDETPAEEQAADQPVADEEQDAPAQGEQVPAPEADDRAGRAAELTAAAQALFQDPRASAQAGEGDDLGGVPAVAVPAEDDDADEGDADQDDAEGTDGAQGPDADADQGSTETTEAPAMPSFGLVFQAPDLSDLPKRRSRRATSAATAPPERADDEPEDSTSDGGRDAERDSDGDDEQSAAGRRRRRGGKGRRPRTDGADSDDGDGDSGETDGRGRADAQSGGADGDDRGDDGSGDGDGGESSSGGSRRRRSRRGRGSSGGSGSSGGGSGDSGGGSGSSDGGGRGGAQDSGDQQADQSADDDGDQGTKRRRRRTRSGQTERSAKDEVTSVKGSTRLEAKRQRRREGREAGRRRTIITEAEFLARRESVDRVMVVRGLEDRTQIAVLEDGVPVEHYVSRSAQSTMAGNVYLGRVQNVLPSMEAAFVDIGKGRNAVLYAGEVNWDAAGLVGNEPRRIENALKSGESVLVQVTKDPIGHKGARLTSQVSLPGRFLVFVPGNSMTGISRKLPENERTRLKKILKEVVPDDAGVIVRTAAEGASEAELRADVERLTAAWERIQAKAKTASAPALLHGEPDMTVRVIRDVFNEDFSKLIVSGDQAWTEVKRYIDEVAPDLADRVEKHTGTTDIFTAHRVHEAIAKAMDRKVWLPSGGSLVIDRTEAMTVVDVNTGKFTGSGGNLEETVTKNNIEAAEEIVRQLRLRDIGGIIVIDFIDMVLEANRDLVVRRLLECLGRDRTKHQVAEVTSLGLVQMTRKRVGSGLIEVFSESCAHCSGRGVVVHTEPVGKGGDDDADNGSGGSGGGRRGRGKGRGGNGGNGGGSGGNGSSSMEGKNVLPTPNPNGPTPAQIAAAAHAAALNAGSSSEVADAVAKETVEEVTETTEVEQGSPETSGGGSPRSAKGRSAKDESAQAESAQGEPTQGEAAKAEAKPATRRSSRGRAKAPAQAPEETAAPEAAQSTTQAAESTGSAEAAQSTGASETTEAPDAAQAPEDAPAVASQAAADQEADQTPAKPARRRGGRRAVSAPATAPEATEPVVPVAPLVPAPEQAATPAPEQAATPAPDQEPAPAERPARRRRGRVSAPAGPPTGAEATPAE